MTMDYIIHILLAGGLCLMMFMQCVLILVIQYPNSLCNKCYFIYNIWYWIPCKFQMCLLDPGSATLNYNFKGCSTTSILITYSYQISWALAPGASTIRWLKGSAVPFVVAMSGTASQINFSEWFWAAVPGTATKARHGAVLGKQWRGPALAGILQPLQSADRGGARSWTLPDPLITYPKDGLPILKSPKKTINHLLGRPSNCYK